MSARPPAPGSAHRVRSIAQPAPNARPRAPGCPRSRRCSAGPRRNPAAIARPPHWRRAATEAKPRAGEPGRASPKTTPKRPCTPAAEAAGTSVGTGALPHFGKVTRRFLGSGRTCRSEMMKPRVTLITLGVADLEASLRFYRDGLGLPTKGVIGQEFEHGAVVFIDLLQGLRLALFERRNLAHDAGIAVTARSASEFTLGHNVASEREVD